jgi:predicted permease
MRVIAVLRQWVRRLRLLIRHDAAERAMDEELRHHIDCEAAERIARGMPPGPARLGAMRDFGGIERFKEEARDARGVRLAEDLAADARYAARVLLRHPGFTAAAVLTFAVGIGVACAIFSVVYGVLLRPLPYAQPGRLVVLWERNIPRNQDRNVVAVENFEAWRDRSHVFDGIAALVPRPVALRADDGTTERIRGAEVSVGYFHLLGIAPLLGRDFRPEDANPGAAAVILSHGFWTTRLGGDPAVIGRMLTVSGKPYTIVGVMRADFEPPQFGWLGSQELWFPFVATSENRAWGRFLLVVARMRPDVSLARVRADMRLLGDQLSRDIPADRGWAITAIPLAEQITGDARTALLVVLGAVGLLLLIAVTNVATLTLSFMRRRTQELATRRSLGATDRRLFSQLFTQSALLGALGAGAGLLAAWPALRVIVSLAPQELPRLDSIRVDRPVLLVMTGVAVVATVLSGSVAALRGRSGLTSLASEQRSGDRASARTSSAVLVVVEIAVALTLTVMAILTVRSFAGLRAVNLGFNSEGVIATRVILSGRGGSRDSVRSTFEAVLEHVRARPEVQAAGLISTRPFGGLGVATEATDPLQPSDASTYSTVADIRYTDAALFNTLRIPVVRGRVFDSSESITGPPRIVISESLARALWPGQDAIGRRLHLDLYNGIAGEVIGVVSDVHLMDPRTAPRPAAYLSNARFPDDTRDVVVRVSGDADLMGSALRRTISEVDPDATVYQIVGLPQLVAGSVAGDRFTTFLLSLFAAIALALSGIGVFGVISGDVALRRKELGIRMALGARTRDVLWMMLKQALARAAAGVACGGVVALALARSMRSLLFGVGPADPLSFLTVAIIVFGLASVATLIPAIRAIQSSPLVTLREG